MTEVASQNRIFVTVYRAMAASLIAWFGWTVTAHPIFTFSLNNDFWEHSAVVREWMKDLWHPKNPHLAIETGSPRYMPFYFVLAALGKVLGLSAIDALKIGAVFNVGFLTLGVFLFFRIYFRSALAPIIGLIVLLTGWGIGWTWSNVYQLRGMLYVAPYPSSFCFAATLICLWLQISILRSDQPSIGKHAGLAIMVALTVATHPLTGAFAVGALGLMVLSQPDVRAKTRVTSVLCLGAALLLAELWPFYSVIQVTLGVSGGESGSWISRGDFAWDARPRRLLTHPFYDPAVVTAALGPAIAGLACLWFVARRREYRFILLGALSMLLPYAINLIYPIPLGHRFLLFAIFFLHLAMVWAAMESLQTLARDRTAGAGSLPARFAAAGIGTVIVFGLVFNLAFAQLDYNNHVAQWRPLPATIGKVVRAVPDTGIIMARPMVAWPVPTFSGKVVSLFHPNPMVADAAERKHSVARFFDPDTSPAERTDILRRYDVSHVLISVENTADNVIRYLSAAGSIEKTQDGFQLFALHPPRS
jgi:hypothetical protein